MSEPQTGRYDSIARRWLALVERRQEHFIELCDTGRWRHYYTHDEFLIEMRKVLRVRDRWAAIAGLAATNGAANDEGSVQDEIYAFPHRVAPSADIPESPWQNGFNGV